MAGTKPRSKKVTSKKARSSKKPKAKEKKPYVWNGDPRLPAEIAHDDNKLTKNLFADSEYAYPPPCNDTYDPVTETTTKGNGKPWPAEFRRRWLLEKAEEIGLMNVNKTEAAKMMGISRQYLYDDISMIYKLGIPKEYIDHAKVDMARIFDRNLKKAMKFTDSLDAREALLAIQTVNATMKDKIEFMEKFGIKKPVEANVSQEVVVRWQPLPQEKQLSQSTHLESDGNPDDKGEDSSGN